MSGNDELGDIIAELTKLQEEHEALKAKVREVSCLKHILDKGDAGEETQEQFDDSWDELDLLVDIGEISINLFPVDELNELRDKVLEYLDVEATVLSTDLADLERMQVYTFEWDKVREELRSLARAGKAAPPKVARDDERREPSISRDIRTINRIEKIFRLAIQSEIGNVHAWVERYFVRKEELVK